MRKVLIIDDVPCASQMRPHLAPLGFEIVQVMRQDRSWGPLTWTAEVPGQPVVLTAIWVGARHERL